MDLSSALPPLLGDNKGRYRVLIVGNSGSGKSTLGAELAALLGIPFISLDTLFWLPGWAQTPTDEFRSKVRVALDQNPRGWVVDGNYTQRLGPIIENEATDIIWLDPPLILYFPRLVKRTFGRLFRVVPQCRPGCPERFTKVFFSQDSIIWWCLSRHWLVRKRETEKFRLLSIHTGGKRRRIGGWGGELNTWKQSIRDMLQVRAAT